MTATISTARLTSAHAAACEVSPPRSPGIWTRLAEVLSTNGDKVYAVSTRVELGRPVLGCSCPDWIYRRHAAGTLCKHLQVFVSTPARDVTRTALYPEARANLTPAGRAFLGVIQAINRVVAG